MSTARHQLAGAPGTGTTIDNMKSRCKAYSGFDQTTLAVYETLNIASLTDIGVGWTGSNFTAVMANNNYNPFVSTFSVSNNYERVLIGDAGTPSMMTCRTMTGQATPTDSIWVTEAAFGILA